MAVTQQLARVTEEYLAACRRSASASPDGDPQWDPPSSDCLDLDWAPALLERAGEVAGLDPAQQEALVPATDGDAELDLGFLSAPPHGIGPFGPAPTALTADGVARVGALLAEIDPERLLAAVPQDPRKAATLLGRAAEGLGDPRAYLRTHLTLLRRFYAQASRRGLLVVQWWD
ncbi:YfbM family protein [Actinacidiphila acidipaludis]|uniref:YfbM family protein n=1 Tax=Actinacidiphila acidipaludis TaxID=2873382 RepID=A0ABS7Q7L4_9ACTN|nr:YfbM family protein [Streptomyces acidipaludis]MBY8879146.1 YfbM family protein [Streptomyces acidipaludis]